MKTFFLGSKLRWFLTISMAWEIVLLLPYATGENWGMVWYPATLPFSEWFKPLWESMGVVFYVMLVALVHALTLFILMNGANGFLNLPDKLNPPKGRTPTEGTWESIIPMMTILVMLYGLLVSSNKKRQRNRRRSEDDDMSSPMAGV